MKTAEVRISKVTVKDPILNRPRAWLVPHGWDMVFDVRKQAYAFVRNNAPKQNDRAI